jgi:uncharacterized protein YecT (DUF1311 family)
MSRILIFLVISMMPLFANSQENHKTLETALSACRELDSYGETYPCAQNVYERSDKMLNIQYKNLANYLQNEDKEKLKLAQRNWLLFRDSDCNFSAPQPKSDDDFYNSNRSYCLAEKTLNRLKELEDYNFWKGCSGCPW